MVVVVFISSSLSVSQNSPGWARRAALLPCLIHDDGGAGLASIPKPQGLLKQIAGEGAGANLRKNTTCNLLDTRSSDAMLRVYRVPRYN